MVRTTPLALPTFCCALASRICRLSGEHRGHLIEALLHARTGEIASLFGRVAVLGDGHLRPFVARGFEDDNVWNVVRNPLGGFAQEIATRGPFLCNLNS